MLRFEAELGMQVHYSPNNYHPAEHNMPGVSGDAILSRLPLIRFSEEYYHNTKDPLPHHTPGVPGSTASSLLMAEVEKEGELFRIGTTHFTWADGGGTNDMQKEHLVKLFALLDAKGEFVLTGDFNAPRGGEIFSAFAAKYADNIPPHITTSIDGSLHRAGPLPYMVDGIFSTPEYKVSDVVLHEGLSDHYGFTATISRS